MKAGRRLTAADVGIAAVLIALSAVAGWAFLVRRSPPDTTAPRVYYMPCARNAEAEQNAPVRVFDVTTGKERLFGSLNDASPRTVGYPIGCFAISPDGRTLLFCGLATSEADLMLIEHFR